ncbi:hypothetical protein MZTS_02610 [Methylorubrum zatmanii]|nr:hypothetical protein [Methylorubrum zatmanii]
MTGMATRLHELPRPKRLGYIERIFIRHPSIMLAADTLDILTDVPAGQREATVGYVRGYSRCGKSETLKRHIEKLTGVMVEKRLEQLISGNGHLVVYVEIAAGDTPLGVAQRILALFEDLKLHRRRPGLPQDRERDAIRRAIDIANDNGVTLLALDEVQNLFRTGSDADVAKTASMLISMQNASGFPIAITASPNLQALFDGSDAVQERAGPNAFLRPLPFRDEAEQETFRSLVSARRPHPTSHQHRHADQRRHQLPGAVGGTRARLHGGLGHGGGARTLRDLVPRLRPRQGASLTGAGGAARTGPRLLDGAARHPSAGAPASPGAGADPPRQTALRPACRAPFGGDLAGPARTRPQLRRHPGDSVDRRLQRSARRMERWGRLQPQPHDLRPAAPASGRAAPRRRLHLRHASGSRLP